VSRDGERRTFSLILVCSSYPPVVGGSEVEAQRICSALISRGHRVTVATMGGPPMPSLRKWTDPTGVPVRIYAARWHGVVKHVMFAISVVWLLVRERRNYQAVYFLMQGLHLAAGLPVAKMLGKTILMKVGGSGVLPAMARTPTGRLEIRWLRKWANRVMILNEGMRAEALAARFSADRLVWMPNPVDTEQFSPAPEAKRRQLRAQYDVPAEAFVIIYTGRLAPEKSLHLLVEAFDTVWRQRAQAYLVLVGDGPMRAALTKQTQHLGCQDSVCFVGGVAPMEIPRWLQMADVFALVSLSEGFPCALVEAMSAGLASVVSDIPANRQLVQPETHGLLSPPGDASAMAAALIRVLDDHEVRARMGEEARRSVKQHYATERVLGLYETMLADTIPTTNREGRAVDWSER
jgi:glycosyltransferase involved in cell wall biosynthesis